jgi:hypothetical protein
LRNYLVFSTKSDERGKKSKEPEIAIALSDIPGLLKKKAIRKHKGLC